MVNVVSHLPFISFFLFMASMMLCLLVLAGNLHWGYITGLEFEKNIDVSFYYGLSGIQFCQSSDKPLVGSGFKQLCFLGTGSEFYDNCERQFKDNPKVTCDIWRIDTARVACEVFIYMAFIFLCLKLLVGAFLTQYCCGKEPRFFNFSNIFEIASAICLLIPICVWDSSVARSNYQWLQSEGPPLDSTLTADLGFILAIVALFLLSCRLFIKVYQYCNGDGDKKARPDAYDGPDRTANLTAEPEAVHVIEQQQEEEIPPEWR